MFIKDYKGFLNGCELLMSEEEFNEKTSRLVNEKYEYIASCGHKHCIRFGSFKNDSLVNGR